MVLFKQANQLSRFLAAQKLARHTIGFVPTMGALHQGHLSLIEAAKKENSLTVCSIFINPTQFNNAQDFQHYPVTLESDVQQLLSAGCDVLFLPEVSEIYPPQFHAPYYTLGHLETVLEGRYRPGHFQGVCQVVDRLLAIVDPHTLYLGAKDYQQCMVIAHLLTLRKTEPSIAIRIQPTHREADGLAMSSRNLRLTQAQRKQAPALYEALLFVQQHHRHKPLLQLEQEAAQRLEQQGFRVDYLSIVDADTLAAAKASTNRKLAVVAAHLGEVRLIDNLLLD